MARPPARPLALTTTDILALAARITALEAENAALRAELARLRPWGERRCTHCGATFAPARQPTTANTFCSPACARAWHRDQARARRAEFRAKYPDGRYHPPAAEGGAS